MDERDTLKKFASEVSQFWHGAHLHLNIIDKDVPPSMDWYSVNFPVKDLSLPKYVQKTILYHEWGHRTISPETPERAGVWRLLILQTLKEEFGVWEIKSIWKGTSWMILNMLTDLWVDDFYMRNELTRESYIKGTKFNIERSDNRLEKNCETQKDGFNTDTGSRDNLIKGFKLFNLFTELYKAIIAFKNDRSLKFSDSLTEKSYKLIFNNKLKYVERIVRFTKLIKNLIPEDNFFVNEININGVPESTEREEVELDAHAIYKYMKTAGIKASSSELKTLFGIKEGMDIHLMINELSIYSDIVESVNNYNKKAISKKGFSGYTTWNLGDRFTELEYLRVFERFGQLIPGVNTIKKAYLKGKISKQREGSSNICIIADDSGSISFNNTLKRMQEAIYSVVLAAENRGDSVSLVIFGSEITYSIGPSVEFRKVKQAVLSMDGGSGGTLIFPALKRAKQYASVSENQTTFIFTDSYLNESFEEIGSEFSKLSMYSKIICFIFSNDKKEAEEFHKHISFADKIKIFFVGKGEYFYETSLEEIYL